MGLLALAAVTGDDLAQLPRDVEPHRAAQAAAGCCLLLAHGHLLNP
jgi:hypothetical protein